MEQGGRGRGWTGWGQTRQQGGGSVCKVPNPGLPNKFILTRQLPSAVRALCPKASVIKIRNESPLVGDCTRGPKNDGKVACPCHGGEPKSNYQDTLQIIE